MKTQTVEEFVRDMQVLSQTFSLTPALEECRPIVLEQVNENFQSMSTAGGIGWPPRKNPKPQHPLLNLSGALLAAATGTGSQSINRILPITAGERLEVGVDHTAGVGSIRGARRHNFGDDPPGIRRREFMAINEETVTECVEVIADAVLARFA